MSHYYSEKNDSLKSNRQKISINFNNRKIDMYTDNGVFCKDYLDFGTRVMLENVLIEGNKVLDLGCGYGPVGVILGLLYPDLDITMVDINERAIELSKMNVELNKINAKVYKSNALTEVEGKFSTILTNPPIRAGKSVVFSFYDQSYDHLELGGFLYVVIQKKQGAQSSIAHLNELFGNCEVVCKEKGYYILKSIR